MIFGLSKSTKIDRCIAQSYRAISLLPERRRELWSTTGDENIPSGAGKAGWLSIVVANAYLKSS